MRNSDTSRMAHPSMASVVLTLAACFAAMAAISCGGGMASGGKSQNSSDLTLSKTTLDFGNVKVGSNAASTLTLTNAAANGSASVTISQISVSGNGFSATFPNLPLVLMPGQSSTITLTFAPKTPGAANGSLALTVDGIPGAATIPLTGTGVSVGQLTVAPAALSFGDVAVGSSKSLGGILTAGSASVTVTSADWSGQGYSITGIRFPVTISSGQSVSFTVNFAPGVAGASSGSVSFISNASNSPTTQTFTGNGTQVSQHVVDLTWDPSQDVVVGYNVYRGTNSGGPYVRLNSSLDSNTEYKDNQVQAGGTYYYVTTAVDSDSNESAYSNQATARVPSP